MTKLSFKGECGHKFAESAGMAVHRSHITQVVVGQREAAPTKVVPH